MQIGSFFCIVNGYEGIIEMVMFDICILIVLVEQSDVDKVFDWCVYCGDGGEGLEIGVGWNEIGECVGDYVLLCIDDFVFVQLICVVLFQSIVDKLVWLLCWNCQLKLCEQD